MGCDVVCSIIFILALRWISKKEKAAVTRSIKNNQIKASDYTVQLHRLPPHRDLDELREDVSANKA